MFSNICLCDAGNITKESGTGELADDVTLDDSDATKDTSGKGSALTATQPAAETHPGAQAVAEAEATAETLREATVEMTAPEATAAVEATGEVDSGAKSQASDNQDQDKEAGAKGGPEANDDSQIKAAEEVEATPNAKATAEAEAKAEKEANADAATALPDKKEVKKKAAPKAKASSGAASVEATEPQGEAQPKAKAKAKTMAAKAKAKAQKEEDAKTGETGGTSAGGFGTKKADKVPKSEVQLDEVLTNKQVSLKPEEAEVPMSTKLETRLAEVKQLCVTCQLFDAVTKLGELEEMASTFAEPAFKQKLGQDTILKRLRSRQKRWDSEWVPHIGLARPDADWTLVEESLPDVGPSAKIRLKARYLQGSEKDPNGARSQVGQVQELLNMPISFEVFLSAMLEVDTLNKKMIDGCSVLHCVPGGPDKFQTGYKHLQISPPIPFFKFYLDIMTDFVLCAEPPPGLEKYGPGALMLDWTTKENDVDSSGLCDGFQIQPKPYFGMPMSSLGVNYIIPSADAPGCTSVIALVKMGYPLPEWVVPVAKGAGVLLTMAKGNMKKWKEFIFDDVPKLAELTARRQKQPDFYTVVEGLAHVH